MKDIYPTNHWIKTHGDMVLDLVRIYLGAGLILKGLYFMRHYDYLLDLLDTLGSTWFAPANLIHYVVLAHICGGLCLMVGLFTRSAAVLQLPILVGALFYIHVPQLLTSVEARQSAEFEGLVLFLLALFSVYGAGRLSVDYACSKKEHPDLFETNPVTPRPV